LDWRPRRPLVVSADLVGSPAAPARYNRRRARPRYSRVPRGAKA